MPQASSASSVNTREQPVRGRRLAAGVDHASAARAVARARAVDRLDRLDAAAHRWLVAHSITLLRLSLGAVFLAFGILKLFPGVSPAEDLVKTTTHILTFGLVPGSLALAGVAVLECVIGLCLLSGRALRPAVYLLGIQLVGILSPIVLLTSRMFDGPHHAPTLEGQYVLKDLILVAATLVLAATLRGGKLESTRPDGESPRSQR